MSHTGSGSALSCDAEFDLTLPGVTCRGWSLPEMEVVCVCVRVCVVVVVVFFVVVVLVGCSSQNNNKNKTILARTVIHVHGNYIYI